MKFENETPLEDMRQVLQHLYSHFRDPEASRLLMTYPKEESHVELFSGVDHHKSDSGRYKRYVVTKSLVDRLKQDKLVEGRPSPNGRHDFEYLITERGKDILRSLGGEVDFDF